MGSLQALRRGSLLTVLLVFAFLSLLLLILLAILDVFFHLYDTLTGLVVLAVLALLFMLLQWVLSPWIVRWAIRGRVPLTEETNPFVYRTVRELAEQAGVPMPRLWRSEEDAPNAFVFGRTLRSSELVVTRGLLERLNQDEIRGVLAHEIGHLRHRDVIVMTWVSAVPLLAYILARAGFEVLRGASHVRIRGKGAQGVALAVLVSILVAIASYVIYLVTQLLVLYLSRIRESYADAYSGAATRDPHSLASALTKIAYGLSLSRRGEEPSGLRAFFIGDPVKASRDYDVLRTKMSQYDLDRDGQLDAYELQKAIETERRSPWRRANELFATHPPTYKRILLLEQLEEELRKGGLPENVYRYV